MEIVTLTPNEKRIDMLAEEVFWEAIRLAGGLKRLVEFRHLTWLPSLAAASYAIVMKEENLMSDYEIAEQLGVSRETVRNMLRAKPDEIKEYLEGKVEKVDDHKAGGLARLAYETLKKRGELDESVKLTREEISLLNIFWAGVVLTRIRGLDFPARREVIRERLNGLSLTIHDIPLETLLTALPEEIATPAALLKHLKEEAEKRQKKDE